MSIKPENKKFYGREWKKIRKKLIEKIGRKCEICGRTDEQIWLTVHHKNRNPADNREENLLVVCPRCHFICEMRINLGYENNPIQLKLFR